MPLTVDQIITGLSKLKPKELSKVRDACTFLIGNKSTSAKDNQDHTLIWNSMVAELGVAGVRHVLSYNTFLKTAAAKNWKANCEVVTEFLDSTFAEHIGKDVTKQGLLRLLFGCLMADLRRRGVPITAGTVALNLGHLPEAFEGAFPGYMASGLGHLVIAGMRRGREAE